MSCRASIVWSVICAAFFAALFFSPAQADKRIALVIGNSNYKHAGVLGNPANDAAAIATLLKAAGFASVDVRRDLGIAEMRRGPRRFFGAGPAAPARGRRAGAPRFLAPPRAAGFPPAPRAGPDARWGRAEAIGRKAAAQVRLARPPGALRRGRAARAGSAPPDPCAVAEAH